MALQLGQRRRDGGHLWHGANRPRRDAHPIGDEYRDGHAHTARLADANSVAQPNANEHHRANADDGSDGDAVMRQQRWRGGPRAVVVSVAINQAYLPLDD